MREADQPKGARFPAASAKGRPVAFLSGLCPHCGAYWTVKAHGHRGQKYCGDACRKNAWKLRRAESPSQTPVRAALGFQGRMAAIQKQIASGELTLVPGNHCRTCNTEVEVGTESLPGRTWERCACGCRWLGRWRDVA